MARIGFLVTAGSWDDQRQFHKQTPALAVPGNKVYFIAGNPGRKVTERFEFIPLTSRQRKSARLTGGLNLLGLVLCLRLDAIQLCSVEQLPLGFVLKALTGIKVIYDCREDTPSAMLKHRLRFPVPMRWFMYYFTRLVEYIAVRIFDGLVVSDPALYRIHYGAKPERKVVFFNTPLLEQFKRDYLPLEDRKYDVVMLGLITPHRGVATMFEAMGLLKQRGRSVRLLLLGEPDPWAKGIVDYLIEKYDIREYVTITGWMSYEKIPNLLKQGKIGIAPHLDMLKFRRNISCRTFEYMACGIPCVCSDLPPQRMFIRHGENGLFYPPGDVRALAGAVESLLSDLPRAQRMGQTGRRDVERWWNAERDQVRLRVFYKGLLSGARLDPAELDWRVEDMPNV